MEPNITADIKNKIDSFTKEAVVVFENEFYKFKEYSSKENFRDLVTKTDNKIELMFTHWLNSNFPSHRVIGEESQNKTIEYSDWSWYIDPIDGTTSFIHKISDCAIILAALYKGIPQLSWIIFPIEKRFFFAQKNIGSFLNGKRLKINQDASLSDSLIYAVASKDFPKFASVYKYIWDKTRGVRMPGSTAVCFSSICLNINQISILDNTYIWEYAAGCLLVKEAGGFYKSLDGNDIDFTNTSENLIIAQSPNLIDQVLQNIRNQ